MECVVRNARPEVWLTVALATAASMLTGCEPKGGEAAPVASASASASASAAPVASGLTGTPVPPDEVARVVNPKNEKPYSGPVGVLEGRITLDGDEPIDTAFKFKSGCGEAAASYSKLFRVGQDRTLADVLVAVTGYEGFVPAKESAQKLTIQGCAFNRNTVALSFGQRLEVANLDQVEAYMPFMDGAPFRAVMVAIPQGDPIRLYPNKPGRYLVRDQLPHEYLVANIFVVAYSTHSVTGLDGRYRIEGIPVGKVRVNALLPAVRKTAQKELEIKEGKNELDLVISYDAEKDKPAKVPKPVWGDRKLPKPTP